MDFFTLFGKYLLMLKGMFTVTENKQMFWKEYIRQCVDIGIGSLPIVVIISFFLGAVTTVQTASQLVSPLVPLATALTLGASLAFMMPVGTPPNAIVFGSGFLRIKDMIRYGFILNLISLALISLFVILFL